MDNTTYEVRRSSSGDNYHVTEWSNAVDRSGSVVAKTLRTFETRKAAGKYLLRLASKYPGAEISYDRDEPWRFEVPELAPNPVCVSSTLRGTVDRAKALISEAHSSEDCAAGFAYAEQVGYGDAEEFFSLAMAKILYSATDLESGARYPVEPGSI